VRRPKKGQLEHLYLGTSRSYRPICLAEVGGQEMAEREALRESSARRGSVAHDSWHSGRVGRAHREETGRLGGFDRWNQFPAVGACSNDSLSAIPEARISARAASRIRGQ